MIFTVSDITASTIDLELEPMDTGAASTSGTVTASNNAGNPKVRPGLGWVQVTMYSSTLLES